MARHLRLNPLLMGALTLSMAFGAAHTPAWAAQAPQPGQLGDLSQPGRSNPSAPETPVVDNKVASRLLVDEVKPEYPPLAKLNYIQGSVRVQLRITREGRVVEAHVVRGHPFLAEATLQAVRRWVYNPLKRGSQVTGFLTVVDVKFSLHGRNAERLPPTPEQDLDRQVQPPALLESPPLNGSAEPVRMRVLVGPKGSVLDAEPLRGPPTGFGAARRTVEGWQFKPARWGNHAVPWYLDIDVPADFAQARGPGDPPEDR